MEPEIECEEEIFIDPTRLTLKVAEGILFDTGLFDFYSKQVYTGEPTYLGLTDYDVVISVTKRDDDAEKTRIITDVERVIRAYIAKQIRKYIGENMELVPLKCNKCGMEFLALMKEGVIECPGCGAIDRITIEEGDA